MSSRLRPLQLFFQIFSLDHSQRLEIVKAIIIIGFFLRLIWIAKKKLTSYWPDLTIKALKDRPYPNSIILIPTWMFKARANTSCYFKLASVPLLRSVDWIRLKTAQKACLYEKPSFALILLVIVDTNLFYYMWSHCFCVNAAIFKVRWSPLV